MLHRCLLLTLHSPPLWLHNVTQMAVLTTLSHPNIVRVYACLTDMVEEAGEETVRA